MKVVYVYPSSCEYAYPKYLDRFLDPDSFDLEIIAHSHIELRYLKGLHELGIDCSLLYPCRFNKPVKQFIHKEGYRIVRCPITFWEGKLGYEVSIPLLQQMIREKPDIVHFHGIYRNSIYPDMFDITALFCKLNSIPFVGQYHTGQLPKYSFNRRKMKTLKNCVILLKQILKTIALRSCTGLCSVNQLELEKLYNPYHSDYYGINFNKIPSRLLPNTFDSNLFHPIHRNKALGATSLNGDKKYVLIVSRLFYEKGLHHLIRIMPIIISRFPNVHLLIIGEYLEQASEYKIMIDNLIEELDIKANITFLGRIEHHEGLINYYNVADMFVLPSYKESFGGVVLEAIACGVPVITTPLVETSYLVKTGVGIIVPHKDEGKLLEAMTTILSHNFVQDEKQRQQVLKQYDYRVVSASLKNWYEELLLNNHK